MFLPPLQKKKVYFDLVPNVGGGGVGGWAGNTISDSIKKLWDTVT